MERVGKTGEMALTVLIISLIMAVLAFGVGLGREIRARNYENAIRARQDTMLWFKLHEDSLRQERCRQMKVYCQ